MRKIDKTTAKIIKKATKIAKKYGIDPQTIDFNALIDPKLTESENLSAIFQHILMLIPDEERREEFRSKYITDVKSEEKRAKEQAEREMDTHISEMLRNIKPRKDHPYYETVKEYIKLLQNSDKIHLLILNGEGGVGKTHLTIGILNDLGIPYHYINGITAFELYDYAQKHNGDLLVLDDVTLTTEMVRLLKAMCDTKDKNRTVTWFSRAKRNSDVLMKFEFTGKVILLLNDISLDLNEHYSALVSRAYLLNIKLSKADMLSLIRGELGDEKYNMFMEDLREMYQKVPERYVIPLISLRTAIKYKTAISISRKLARDVLVNELLDRAKDMKIAIENGATTFVEMTGKSRRTWARYRAMYRYLKEEFVGSATDVPK